MLRHRTILVRRRTMWRKRLTRFAVLGAGAILALAAGASSRAGTSLDGSWVGTFTQLRPAALAFSVRGGAVEVALGAGHATLQRVRVESADGRFRFAVPGRPSPLRFDARLVGDRLVGTA